jgi:hypothetical protein
MDWLIFPTRCRPGLRLVFILLELSLLSLLVSAPLHGNLASLSVMACIVSIATIIAVAHASPVSAENIIFRSPPTPPSIKEYHKDLSALSRMLLKRKRLSVILL